MQKREGSTFSFFLRYLLLSDVLGGSAYSAVRQFKVLSEEAV